MRELVYTDGFLDDLIRFQNYLGRDNPSKGRKFVSKIYDFTLNVIEKMPFAFGKYESENAPPFRRKAVYKKDYIVIYDVLEDTIELLSIYHSSRNPDSIEL